MIRCEPAKGEADKVKVTFVVPADAADKVAVAGDFNGWDPSATTLRKRGDVRSASVTLDAGRRYAFRYCTPDGHWFNDEQAHGYERNEYGEDNSIIDLTDGTIQL